MISRWLDGQPLPVLLAFLVFIFAALFGIAVGSWWVAHQLNWWLFGLSAIGAQALSVAWRVWRDG